MLQIQTLYRPVVLEELELILASGMKRYPPRLPEQPIFYPVVALEYAQQIAEQWNTKDNAGKATRAGFVTAFDLPIEYLERFEEQIVGSSVHREFWIPAEELANLNNSIHGHIRVMEVFYGVDYRGPLFNLETLNTKHEIWS
jgi:hypothetical protein